MGPTAVAAADGVLESLRRQVETGLAGLFPQSAPEALYAPARYVLAGEGKRLRPVLVLLSARLFGVSDARALPAALAVEVFHNFTLVHDDIMDRAETRRGRATVHRKWDEPVAILTGDLLLGEAYRLLATSPPALLPDLIATFSAMVARLCEGQTLDMAFEAQAAVSVDAYRDMIARKTGALVECCLELGGILGEATPEQRAALRRIGHHVGQGFQIQDDLLDLVAEHADWGKPIGGDLVEGKKTFLLLRALERAEGAEAAWFRSIAEDGGLGPASVPEARERMERLGVLADARQAVAAHTAEALADMALLPAGEARTLLAGVVERMAARAR